MTEQPTPSTRENRAYHVDIAGDAHRSVVVGDHNLLVDAQHGSSVTLLVQGRRPTPTRRESISLLPRRQPEPIGRSGELTALGRATRESGLVQLFGPPGIGTSALLRHAAHRLPPGRHGVLYLNAAGREPADLAQEIFEACYDSAGYAPSETELRRLMTGIRAVVYVDNADLGREQLIALADTARDATFVFAGHRRALNSGDGAVVELTGLDRESAELLLARELDRPIGPDERTTAEDLWRTAQGSPLHLLRAAGLAGSGRTGLLPRPGAVAELLPPLIAGLDAPATDVLHLLATLDGADLTPRHLDAITGRTDTTATCERLTRLGLLLAEDDGFRCVSDAAPVALDRADGPYSLDLICAHFTDWIARPATTPAEVARHSAALERTAALAEAAGRPELAVAVARAASPVMAGSLRFGAWGRLLGHGWSAAQQTEDRQAEAYFTHEEGIRSLLTGRRVLAGVLLGQAALLWQRLGDTHAASAALNAQHYAPAAVQPLAAPTAPAAPHLALPTPTAPDPATAAHSVSTHMSSLTPAPHAGPAALPHPAASAAHHAATPAAHGTTAHGTATHATAAHATTAHGTAAHATTAHGTAAHATTAHATAAHTAVHTAAHTAGATGATATGAAGTATAAAGFSGAKVLLLLAVLVGGGYIAREALPQLLDDLFATPPDSIAGTWSTPTGPTVVDSSGSDFTIPDCGTSIRITGSGSSYRATFPVHNTEYGSCGPAIGSSTLNLELSADFRTVRATASTPVGDTTDSFECSICGTWTRLDQ
ncbi:ATP-binding protein [Kitasatospora griseola]|uniref:ATP-binding protein n=1 Tax=Kitasatospora griseola TaxID=2064 RepID=UPI00341F4086